MEQVKRGLRIDNILERIGVISENNIFTMNSYYAEYEATICSNKNTNTYKICEWFKEGMGTKFKFNDEMGNNIIILFNNRQLTVYNEGQKNIFELQEYATNFSNLLSVKTGIEMYLHINDNNLKCCFKCSSYEKKNKIMFVIENKIDEQRMCNCSYRYLTENVAMIELNIDSETGVPDTYIIYDNNKQQAISIVYSKFDINANLKDDIFDI